MSIKIKTNSIFNREKSKEECLKQIAKVLKNNNLAANFKDPKWLIFSKHSKTEIVDIFFRKKKEKKENGDKDNEPWYLLVIYKENEESKNQRKWFLIVDLNIDKKLKEIYECNVNVANSNTITVNDLSE